MRKEPTQNRKRKANQFSPKPYLEANPDTKEYLDSWHPFPAHYKWLEREAKDTVVRIRMERDNVVEHFKDDDPTAFQHLANVLALSDRVMYLLAWAFHLEHHALSQTAPVDNMKKTFHKMEKEFKQHKPIWDFLDHKLQEEVDREERGKKTHAYR